jgi:hypothetical protein
MALTRVYTEEEKIAQMQSGVALLRAALKSLGEIKLLEKVAQKAYPDSGWNTKLAAAYGTLGSYITEAYDIINLISWSYALRSRPCPGSYLTSGVYYYFDVSVVVVAAHTSSIMPYDVDPDATDAPRYITAVNAFTEWAVNDVVRLEGFGDKMYDRAFIISSLAGSNMDFSSEMEFLVDLPYVQDVAIVQVYDYTA